MKFPIAIHKDAGTVYGVIVPDVPGCHSWGNTVDEAIQNAEEAIYSHIETLLELGEEVSLHPSSVEALRRSDEYAGVVWGLVNVDLSELDTKPERVNVSLPKFVLHRIDKYVEKRHETRSGFLARAALNEMAEEH